MVGSLTEVVERPENIILTAAAAGAAPVVLARLGASKLIIKALSKIPASVKKKGAGAISASLTATYLSTAGLRVAKEPTKKEKAEKVGKILAGEVAPFSVGTRIGVRGLMKRELQKEIDLSLKGMSKQRQTAFREYMRQAEVFGKYEPEARNIKLNNVESIPDPKAQKAIRNFLKDSRGNVVVGGSVAQTGQIKVGRKLGDMDLYLEKGKVNSVAKKLADQLKKSGVKRVSNVKGQVTIAGKKAIEFHEIDRLLTNIQQVTPIWSRTRNYIITTPEGVRIQRLGLQARRKLVAAFADPKRLKTGKYRKDLKDFKSISDIIFRNAVRRSRGAFFFRKQKIRAVGKIFKRKIPKVAKIRKIKRVKRVKKIKRVKKVRKVKLSKTELKKVRLKSLKKARVALKKIRKAKRKIRPSQKPVKKRIRRFPPSQRPRKPPRRVPPSQPPKKPPRKPPKPPRRPPRKPPRRVPPSQPPPRKPPRAPPPKPPKAPPPRPPRVPPPKRPPKPPIVAFKIKKRKIKGRIIGYDVFGKRKTIRGKKTKRGAFIKLNTKPLSKKAARDRGAFAIDHTVARTFKIKRIGRRKALGKITKRERGHFKKARKKFRKFKIRKGVKKPIVNKFIERRGKAVIDTRGEKRGLKLSKFIKRFKRGFKRIPSRPKPIKRKPKKLTQRKAKMILREGKTRGKKLTSKQKRFFGAIAGGQKPRGSKRSSKSSLSNKQLNALAAGRKKLAQMRRGK